MRFLFLLAVLVALVVASGGDVSPKVPRYTYFKFYWWVLSKWQKRNLCFVIPNYFGDDDSPRISAALNHDCRRNSLIVFPGYDYNIARNMTTDELENVRIHHYGRFIWSKDIKWWRWLAMPIGFQNQSTVWHFGGNNVQLNGHGIGTLDGNGQIWYDWARGRGNLPGRPMMINWRGLTNSRVKGMRFVQSQMWTMAVSQSAHVDFEDIYVNNTSSSKWSTLNTDGIDTIDSNDIALRRWSITSGDDAISLKRNSTNIHVKDAVIHGGQGLAIGSAGQYKDQYEHIKNFTAKNIDLYNTAYAIYLKTWGGNSKGFPPNGGGGGLGIMSDIALENIRLRGVRKYPLFAWQCENYEGGLGRDCQSSKFSMQNFTVRGMTGWVNPSVDHLGWFQCSAAAGGCNNFTVADIQVTKGMIWGPDLTLWHCENMHNNTGFECSD